MSELQVIAIVIGTAWFGWLSPDFLNNNARNPVHISIAINAITAIASALLAYGFL